jgi:hypothetical protein
MYSIAYYSVKHNVAIPIPIKIIDNEPINLWDQAWNIFTSIKKTDSQKSYIIIYGLTTKNIFPHEKPKLKEVYNLLTDLNTLSMTDIARKFYNSNWYLSKPRVNVPLSNKSIINESNIYRQMPIQQAMPRMIIYPQAASLYPQATGLYQQAASLYPPTRLYHTPIMHRLGYY